MKDELKLFNLLKSTLSCTVFVTWDVVQRCCSFPVLKPTAGVSGMETFVLKLR